MNKTIDELIQLAKNPLPKEDNLKNLSPFKQFILSTKIRSGDYPVPAYLILDKYEKWCKANDVEMLTSGLFYRQLKRNFDFKNTAKGVHYLLNPEGFDLSATNLEEILQKQRRLRKNYAEKKKEQL